MMEQQNDNYPWNNGRVPNGYWDERENRVRYMDWLASICNFKNPEDWYSVRKTQFKKNRGGGLLCTQYRDSIYVALQDYRPDFQWLPWRFSRTRNNYWSSADNRRQYMNWLRSELELTETDQWYSVTKQTFKKHHGAGLLYGCYGDSVLEAVREYQPDHQWHPWLFKEAPHRFWQEAANRRSYMKWLGQKLGYKSPEDWYAVSSRDFIENNGGGLLSVCYGDSPQEATREYLPNLPKQPWLFTSVPQKFWHEVENRMSYLKWLGEELQFQDPTDWFRLTCSDFRENRGSGLLNFYATQKIGKSIAEAIRAMGNRSVVVWPVIQLIECSSTKIDPAELFLALGS